MHPLNCFALLLHITENKWLHKYFYRYSVNWLDILWIRVTWKGVNTYLITHLHYIFWIFRFFFFFFFVKNLNYIDPDSIYTSNKRGKHPGGVNHVYRQCIAILIRLLYLLCWWQNKTQSKNIVRRAWDTTDFPWIIKQTWYWYPSSLSCWYWKESKYFPKRFNFKLRT